MSLSESSITPNIFFLILTSFILVCSIRYNYYPLPFKEEKIRRFLWPITGVLGIKIHKNDALVI